MIQPATMIAYQPPGDDNRKAGMVGILGQRSMTTVAGVIMITPSCDDDQVFLVKNGCHFLSVYANPFAVVSAAEDR